MYAFVLMPFLPEFDDVYELGIIQATKENGIDACRLDKQIFVSDMLDKIYAEIDKSDFIIADMSTRNPNVFYEVGYADAKKKLVILLTNNSDDIPFDLKHRPHIVYESISQLKKDLIERIKWAQSEIKNIKKEPLKSVIKILSSDVERNDYSDQGELRLRIEIHNRLNKLSEVINSVYLFTGKGWTVFYEDKACQKTEVPEANNVERHIIHPVFSVVPGNDWLPIEVKMKKPLYYQWDKQERKDAYEHEGILRVALNTENQKNVEDHNLKVRFVYSDIPF
jgi:nucleoside 2-deoxyribosyltransferase